MDDEQPSYSSIGNGRRRAHGFEVFPVYKGTGEDFAKMFIEEEVQPTESELGLGAIYDDLECFGGGKKRRKKKKKTPSKSTLAKAYQNRLKRAIETALKARTSPSERKKIYSGFVKSLSHQGSKKIAVQSDRDLMGLVTTYYNSYKNKK